MTQFSGKFINGAGGDRERRGRGGRKRAQGDICLLLLKATLSLCLADFLEIDASPSPYASTCSHTVLEFLVSVWVFLRQKE